MTESEWLAGTDPAPMLDFLRGEASLRKLRLLAAGFARSLDRFVDAGLVDRTVLVAEQMANGVASDAQLRAARAEVIEASRRSAEDAATKGAIVALGLLLCDEAEPGRPSGTMKVPKAILKDSPRYVAGEVVTKATEAATGRHGDYSAEAKAVRAAEKEDQCRLAREIVGNPFRPVAFNPHWRTSDVVGVARAIYEDRAFDRLPILADALMDAGCADEQILAHCRGGGPHVRGCWAVDLALGYGDTRGLTGGQRATDPGDGASRGAGPGAPATRTRPWWRFWG
jgi:hypothetical protein